MGLALVLDALVLQGHLGGVVQALTKSMDGQGRTPPLDGVIVASVAFLTLVDLRGRRVLEPLAVVFIGSAVLTGFLSSGITAMALLSSLLLGWAVGLAVRCLLGAASTRAPGAQVAAALRDCGPDVTALRLDGTDATGARHYTASGPDGTLEVLVLDRDTFGSSALRRLLRRLRLRGPAARGPSLTVHAAVERQVLMGLALARHGVTAPVPVAACEVGPFSALVAYRQPAGVPLESAAGHDVSDTRLGELWRLLATLKQAKIAHRGLTGQRILLIGDRGVGLADVGEGDVAAADLALRLDAAELLTTASRRSAGMIERARARTGIDPLKPGVKP
jgi:hypothetical protein